MEKSFNFALVGCGNIAKKHIHVIENFIDNGKIIGLCDTMIEKAQALGAPLNIPTFSNISEMMSQIGKDIDVISILTPSGSHYKNVMELVRYEKPIIIEKPITLNLDETDHLLEACDNHGIKIFVVHQNRYNRPIIAAKRALDEGRLGKMVMGTVRLRWKRDQAYYDAASWRGTWAYDGGVFTNQASHHIDMLTWFFGPVESVKAISSTRLVNIECEDTGAAIIKFVSGAIGIIEATTATRPNNLEGSISILGEKGSIVVGGFFMNKLETWEFETPNSFDDTVFENFGNNPEQWAYNLGEYLKGVMDSVTHHKSGLVDGLEGRKSLELISAIYESIETGKEISLRFHPQKCRLGFRDEK